MTNGDHKGRIFQFHPHTNNGFFSCLPLNTLFYIRKNKKGFQKILTPLRYGMVTSFLHYNDATERRAASLWANVRLFAFFFIFLKGMKDRLSAHVRNFFLTYNRIQDRVIPILARSLSEKSVPHHYPSE